MRKEVISDEQLKSMTMKQVANLYKRLARNLARYEEMAGGFRRSPRAIHIAADMDRVLAEYRTRLNETSAKVV